VSSRLPQNSPAWLDRLSLWLEPFEVCFTHVAQRGAFRRYLPGLRHTEMTKEPLVAKWAATLKDALGESPRPRPPQVR
jgi:hypothetical protein